MNNKKFVIYNSLFKSNPVLLRILIILYKFPFHDVLFIPNIKNIMVCFKGFINAYEEYEMFFQHKYNHYNINFDVYKMMTHHIKLECNLNIFILEPQSGIFKINIDNQDYYIRASFHPNDYGFESMSLRIIRPNIISSIMLPKLKIGGLILIGGRTCSGKTSLMYNILNNLKNSGSTIITLEDPVEFEIDGITQTDIKHISYNDGIKSILRQNPDWICIGEIRDKNSAAAAIRAAMTGHNIIATIHIKDSQLLSLFNRFEEMDCKYLSQVISQFIYCYRLEDNFQYITHENIENDIANNNILGNLINI